MALLANRSMPGACPLEPAHVSNPPALPPQPRPRFRGRAGKRQTIADRSRQTRLDDRDALEMDIQAHAVFGEVETLDEFAPTMLALLRALPGGTRV
jgi:hypothetical protein